MLRVLVAEDSPTARALLLEILRSAPDVEIVGTAASGKDAVEMTTRLRPDVITMDVQMPGMDGLQATREIMSVAPTPIVIVSSTARGDAALSLSATEAGALAVVPKPEGPLSEGFADQRDYLLRMVRAMATVRLVRRWRSPDPVAGAVSLPAASRLKASPKVIAIGASTGGPAALRGILHELPVNFPLPILVVQHIARGFTQGLADWLTSVSSLPVRLATVDEVLRPGMVYLAPDDRHLGISDDLRVVLSSAPAVGQFRPSVTYLLRSVAAAVGGAAIGIVMTGMGEDGLDGLRDLYQAGGYVVAQDEASSVIYGMAKEAVRAGVVSEILPLAGIAPRLIELTRGVTDA